ncbi:MAG: signal peptidase II [Oscillospiraceae bacterium]|nr:signal peptidase II [Oscillospiraceae bacterium]
MRIGLAKHNRSLRLYALIVAVTFIGVDRLTKQIATERLIEDGRHLSVNLISINGREILNLSYCENTGAAFSILQGQRWFLIGVTGLLLAGVLALLLTDLFSQIQSRASIAALALILAGGTGNLIDRIFYGYVVDFIDFRIINFPVFNVADICAVTGSLLLLFAMIRDEIKSASAKKKPAIISNENE